jgi:hypothetical protein
MPDKNNNTPPTDTTTSTHHPARTFFASLFGFFAVLLIMSSIISIWMNRTLTDTNTFVAVIAPLATKPEVQNFVAQKASEQLVKNAPTQELSNVLLPEGTRASAETDAQLKALLQPIIYNNVLKIVASPTFAAVWKDTNQTAHAALVSQLSNDSGNLSLDLNPLITDVVSQLKTTDLAQVSDQITVSPDAGKVNLQNSGIDKAHSYYTAFKRSTIVVVIAALICTGAAIALSVHHLKTVRRILLGTGVAALLLAGSIQVPSLVAIKLTDASSQKVVVVIIQSLFHNLQIASLITGVVCITVAIGIKVYEKLTTKK